MRVPGLAVVALDGRCRLVGVVAEVLDLGDARADRAARDSRRDQHLRRPGLAGGREPGHHAAARPRCRGGARGRGRPAQRAAHRRGLEARSRDDRQQERQRLALLARRVAEGAAAVALANVAAQRAAQERAAAQRRELLADDVAVGVACVALVHERRPGLEDECLDLLWAAADDRCDLVAAEIAEAREQQCRTLILGKLLEVTEQLAQVATALDAVGKPLRRRLEDGVVDVGVLAAGADDGQAAVARDLEEPWLDVDVAVVGTDVPVQGDEGVLRRVLAVGLGAQHVAAEAEDAKVVAVIEHLEGRCVSLPDHLHQALVGPARKQEPTPHPRGYDWRLMR